MSLHRSWRAWVPIVLTAFVSVLFLLTPTLNLDLTGLFGVLLGEWVAYPVGVVLLLLTGYLVRSHRQPFLVRVDEAGVVWRAAGAGGAASWPEIVRIAIERNPDDPPRRRPSLLTVWLRQPLAAGPDPDVRLDGLVGYRLADIRELVESAEEIMAGLRRYAPATLPVAAGPEPAAPPAATSLVKAATEATQPGHPLGYDRRAPADGECAYCGSAPARFLKLQSVVSWVLGYSVRSDRCWMCRDCAIARYRALTTRMYWGAWWGPGLIALPIFLIVNGIRMRPVAAMPPPHRSPDVVAPLDRPLDPGQSLWRRPATVFALVMAVVVVVFLVCLGATITSNEPTA